MNRIDELIKKLCPNGVEYKKASEIKIESFWLMPSTPTYIAAGVPYITSKNIKNGKINFENVNYISEKDYLSISSNRTIKKNDLLITMIGTIGETAFVEEDIKFYGQNMYLIRLNEKVINRKFFNYYLTSEKIKNSLVSRKNTSSQGYIKAGSIENLLLPVPPLEIQCEIVHILDDFTLLSAELSAELKARQKQYEYYLYKLISDSKKITKNKLYELTIWDKKFNAVENYMQPNVKKYPTLLAVDLFNLERENGNVFLLSTGGQRGWTTEEVAGDNISEGEVVTIPWGKSRPVQEVMKYYCGKFVTGDNRIATSNDIKKLNNKYLFYWMQTQSERIDKFYRGSGIQHPNMRNVLTLEIELPSIDEQKRIVSILDKFEKLCNDISQGLPAEIEARQKQYEYYRDKLLTFKELKVNE